MRTPPVRHIGRDFRRDVPFRADRHPYLATLAVPCAVHDAPAGLPCWLLPTGLCGARVHSALSTSDGATAGGSSDHPQAVQMRAPDAGHDAVTEAEDDPKTAFPHEHGSRGFSPFPRSGAPTNGPRVTDRVTTETDLIVNLGTQNRRTRP